MRLPDRVGRAGFSPLCVGRTIAKPRGFTAILIIVVAGKDGCIILAGKSIWLRGSTGRRQLRGVLYNLHTSMMFLFLKSVGGAIEERVAAIGLRFNGSCSSVGEVLSGRTSSVYRPCSTEEFDNQDGNRFLLP